MIDYRRDLNLEKVGSGPEDIMFDSVPQSDMMESFTSGAGRTRAGRKIRNPGVMLVVRGASIVRLEAFDLRPVVRVPTEPVKVKSKIGQAVFYGVKEEVRRHRDPMNAKK